MNAAMLNEYFGFNKTPFSISPDPELVYWSEDHREALANLEYSIQQGTGLVLFSGEVGTGKTTIVRRLLSRVQHNTTFALLLNPYLQGEELLVEICREFSVSVDQDRDSDLSVTSRYFNALRDFLITNYESGRQSVVVIDEAQHLSFEAMEQLRLLTNLETDEQKLLLVVFVGQPELRQLIQQPRLRQLAQRITYRPHLKSLSKADTREYIYCRLDHVGYKTPKKLVSGRVADRVFKYTQGVPRSVNTLLERALLVAYADQVEQLTLNHIDQAHREVNSWQVDEKVSKTNWAMWGSAVSVLTVLAVGAILYFANGFYHSKQAAYSVVAKQLGEPSLTVECSTKPSHMACTSVQSIDHVLLRNIKGALVVNQSLGRARVAISGQSGEWQWLEADGSQSLVNEVLEQSAMLIWQLPSDVELPIQLGTVSPVIADLAKKFAEVDGHATPLSSGLYNGRIRDRIRQFQRQHDLATHGQIDQETWLALTLNGFIEVPQI